MQDNFPKDTSHFKLLIADFDGTLAGSDHKISSRVKHAIKQWIDAGGHFAIASGRQFLMVGEDARELGLKTPLIVRGGAEIVDPYGKIILSELIDRKIVKEFVEMMKANGYGVIVEVDNILYGNFIYGVEEYPKILEKPLDELPYIDVPKINVRVARDKIKETEEFMDEQVMMKFPTLHLIKSYNVLGLAYDITSMKATKHLAVLELLKILNIQREDAIGVGDGYNDFPLLEATGFKVAMGNANEELKAIADVVIPPYDEDGIAYLIERLLG